MSFWKKLMGRREGAAERRAEAESTESAAERRFASEGVEGVAADEAAEERLGGTDPAPLVDDEFKP
jgi:hypothetical protein